MHDTASRILIAVGLILCEDVKLFRVILFYILSEKVII